MVKSKTSTVYLFGTIHAMDPSKVWRTPAFEKVHRRIHDLLFADRIETALATEIHNG